MKRVYFVIVAVVIMNTALSSGCAASREQFQPEETARQTEISSHITRPPAPENETNIHETGHEPETESVPVPEAVLLSYIEDLAIEIYGDDTLKQLDEGEVFYIQDDIDI